MILQVGTYFQVTNIYPSCEPKHWSLFTVGRKKHSKVYRRKSCLSHAFCFFPNVTAVGKSMRSINPNLKLRSWYFQHHAQLETYSDQLFVRPKSSRGVTILSHPGGSPEAIKPENHVKQTFMTFCSIFQGTMGCTPNSVPMVFIVFSRDSWG